MTRMWRAAILSVVWSMAAAAPGVAQEKDGKAQKDEARPDITLKVSPLIAFSPARISVRAELKGGTLDYEPFYCTTIVWDWDDGTTSENTPDCAPYEAGTSEIRRYYSSSHTYSMAGRYNVRFRMKKGDRVVGGNSTAVQVRPGIRDPGEIPE
jgi:PKD repeat protein